MAEFDTNMQVLTMESSDATHLEKVMDLMTNDIQEIKSALKEHIVDTREEFRRVRDKIDVLNTQFVSDSKSSAVTLKELEVTQKENAKFAGRIAGAIAGFVTALITSLTAVVAKGWLGH